MIPGFSNPQALNRYSYCLNNPINRIDPDGHWSWKKFFKSFVSTFVQVATTIVLTPFIGPIAAGAVGGFVGGALNAGLNGASFGQAMMSGLVGAGIGALGGAAFGSTGVNGFLGSAGPAVGIGLLVVGGAYSAATGNLDSFTGGVLGGIGGYVAGQGVLDSGALKNNPSVKAYKQTLEQRNNQALKTDKKPEPYNNGGPNIWDAGEMGPEFKGTFDANGNFIGAPNAGNNRITVLGAQDDLWSFQRNPFKYNVLDPSVRWSKGANAFFLDRAIANGDHFMIMRNPSAWNSYTTSTYGKPSRLPWEIQYLQNKGVDSSRIHNMY